MTTRIMQPAPTEDTALVAETLGGNQLSFQLLVERYQGRIFGVVRHYTQSAVEMEDIVQDTFIKAYRKLHTFQHQSSFSTWLYRIAINTALDFLKRAGRNPVRAVEDPEVVGTPGRAGAPRSIAAPDSNLEREEIARITHEVLDELPEIFRSVLILREFEEMAYQDIADLLGISIGTVESRLFRARARFRDVLARLHPEYAVELG
ncbi:MAG TPA: sigma-70 family RNA polymerase sigma factor [Planctomycetes bacterium]|nr:sigma-70 family RNA polymerase sigma factor [Planctomycetota bacterium]